MEEKENGWEANVGDERWQEGHFLWVTEAAVEILAVRTEWERELSRRQAVLLGVWMALLEGKNSGMIKSGLF